MRLNTKGSHDVFAGVAVTALLILTAWGSAKAMLAFSCIGIVAWLAVPGFRGRTPVGRGLVIAVFTAAVAAGVVSMLIGHTRH